MDLQQNLFVAQQLRLRLRLEEKVADGTARMEIKTNEACQ